MIERINQVIAEYDDQRLSVRQIYYRFVTYNWISNTKENYKVFAKLLTTARYAGLVDWDAVEDRLREADIPRSWGSVDQIINAAIDQFHLPWWADQPAHVELWTEKDALSGMLSPIANRWRIPFAINRGYSSSSAMKAAADRILRAQEASIAVSCGVCQRLLYGRNAVNGSLGYCRCGSKARPQAWACSNNGRGDFKPAIILYFGDHDPSGNDMERDIDERLQEFGVSNLRVRKLALTRDQIDEYNLPPNPAKISDSRARRYIEDHGDESWELDALPPPVLVEVAEQGIRSIVDMRRLKATIAREDAERERVRLAIEKSRRAPTRRPRSKR